MDSGHNPPINTSPNPAEPTRPPQQQQPRSPLPQEYHHFLVADLKCLGTHLRVSGDLDATPIALSDPAHPFRDPLQKLTRITNNITSLQQTGLKQQTALTLLQAYTSSAAQHVVRNYFVTDAQAREWGPAGDAVMECHHRQNPHHQCTGTTTTESGWSSLHRHGASSSCGRLDRVDRCTPSHPRQHPPTQHPAFPRAMS